MKQRILKLQRIYKEGLLRIWKADRYQMLKSMHGIYWNM